MNLVRASIALCTTLALVAPNASASIVVVSQSGTGFSPRNITIQVGDTVRWQWSSEIHTVTEGSDGVINGTEAFHRELTSALPTYSVTFDQAFLDAHPRSCNFYDYFCEVHFPGDMRGSIQVGPIAGTSFCFGDGSLPTACPCAAPNFVPSPTGYQGHGCANSLNFFGARLCALGTTAPDTVAFACDIATGYSGFGFLVKGNGQDTNGIAAADGVRCVNGQLIRFGGHNAGTNGAPTGSWTYPNSAQTISVSSATLQSLGQDAFYQLYYRNAEAFFCTTGTTNFSNAIRLSW
ncbi:MAG: plastocyanin/azurin family copper-binding protein [Planctomycetota bacterium]